MNVIHGADLKRLVSEFGIVEEKINIQGSDAIWVPTNVDDDDQFKIEGHELGVLITYIDPEGSYYYSLVLDTALQVVESMVEFIN